MTCVSSSRCSASPSSSPAPAAHVPAEWLDVTLSALRKERNRFERESYKLGNTIALFDYELDNHLSELSRLGGFEHLDDEYLMMDDSLYNSVRKKALRNEWMKPIKEHFKEARAYRRKSYRLTLKLSRVERMIEVIDAQIDMAKEAFDNGQDPRDCDFYAAELMVAVKHASQSEKAL